MRPIEAWCIISALILDHQTARKALHPDEKPYSKEEIEAEVICFRALKEAEKKLIEEERTPK